MLVALNYETDVYGMKNGGRCILYVAIISYQITLHM